MSEDLASVLRQAAGRGFEDYQLIAAQTETKRLTTQFSGFFSLTPEEAKTFDGLLRNKERREELLKLAQLGPFPSLLGLNAEGLEKLDQALQDPEKRAQILALAQSEQSPTQEVEGAGSATPAAN